MFLLYPLFLTGLVALAAPVLIHLLMKVHGPKIPFSTLRFFTKTSGARGKKKIRHWLLLLLRLILLALLVAAFARPFWPMTSAGHDVPQQQRAMVILLDRTASMQAQDSDQPADSHWATAIQAARKALEELAPNDQAAIVGSAEQAEVVTTWTAPSTALDALAPLKPTNEAGRLADGLQQAVALLDHAPAVAQRELVIVSDLQRSGCRDLDSIPLPAGTHYEIKNVATEVASNLAITDLTSEGMTAPLLKAALQNYSPDKMQALPVTVLMDQQPFAQLSMDIEKESSAQATLPNLALSPGWHNLTLEIKRSDAVALDNHFYAAVRIPEPVKVLMIEPNLPEKIFRRSSYFVMSALDPTSESTATDSTATPFMQFAATLSGPDALFRVIDGDAPPKVIILPSLADIPAGIGAALKRYVEKGGGLLVWGGPQLNLLAYNNELADVLPAQLTGVETPDDAAVGGNWRLGWWDGSSPLFQIFEKPGHGDLTVPKFRQRLKLTVNPGTEVLAKFDDETPFLLSSKLGHGRILLVNSSPDAKWSDWPSRKTFLPLVNQMAWFLSQNEASASRFLAPSFAPTHHGEFDLGATRAYAQVKLVAPNGKAIAVQADEHGILRRLDLEQTGIYLIRSEKDEDLQRFCVNFPAAESNLETVSGHELAANLHFQNSASALANVQTDSPLLPAKRELWPWLMALLIPLLLLELIWANRSRS